MVVSLFYDYPWWKENLDTTPPGFHGSGRGILEVIVPSKLGFAIKRDRGKRLQEMEVRDLADTRTAAASQS